MDQINALDGDGHVEEWEGTFSDEYLEPAFRDRRPEVVETGEFEHDFTWMIDGTPVRLGGSPSSKGGIEGTEHARMLKWRGSLESGEFHSAAARLAVMDAENTLLRSTTRRCAVMADLQRSGPQCGTDPGVQ